MAKKKTDFDLTMFTAPAEGDAAEGAEGSAALPAVDVPAAATLPMVDLSVVPAEGKAMPTSVSLRQDEVDMLKVVAERYGVKPHALIRFCVRYTLASVASGQLDLAPYLESVPEVRNKLKMT